VVVSIENLTSDYQREYRLGRWSGKPKTVKPAVRKRSSKAAK
jgi:hypothetical protein